MIPEQDTRKFKPLAGNNTDYNNLRQQWNIERWCREQGMDRRTIETHPCVADIRTLLDFDSLDHLMTKKDQEIWAHAWNWVYKKQLPISVYINKRLLSIVENCKRTEYILKRKQRKAARALSEMKSDQNNEAKGSLSVNRFNLQSLTMENGSGN